MIKVSAPGMQRMVAKLKKYWADDPREMLSALREWWWDEGKRVYATKGRRVGSSWKRLSKAWAARKGSTEINVDSGRLRAGLKGKRHTWSKIGKRKAKVGIMYDKAAFNTIGKWRPLTGVKPKQMSTLDKDMDKELSRFDRTL